MHDIFVISPHRERRAELLPKLGARVSAIKGVQVLSEGFTGIKIKVEHGIDFRKSLGSDILAGCFVKPATQFVLAD